MFKNFFEQFVFFPCSELKKFPSNIKLEYEDIFLKQDYCIIHGWYIKNNNTKIDDIKDKVILFFHGNAGNISFRLNYIKNFYELGFSLLFFDYPGFGLSEGSPNEENCINSGELFFEYLINEKKYNKNNIIFYGESIGGSIACSLGTKLNIKYLVLQSTFTDIKLIIRKILSVDILSLAKIGFNTLDNLKNRYKVNKIKKAMKTLIIHSTEDELIDISHAYNLEKYGDKLIICDGSHSNIIIDDDFIFNFITFLKD